MSRLLLEVCSYWRCLAFGGTSNKQMRRILRVVIPDIGVQECVLAVVVWKIGKPPFRQDSVAPWPADADVPLRDVDWPNRRISLELYGRRRVRVNLGGPIGQGEFQGTYPGGFIDIQIRDPETEPLAIRIPTIG